MQISFGKLSSAPLPFEFQCEGLKFSGTIKRLNTKLARCSATICGDLEYMCDRCGAKIILKLSEKLELLLSDGAYRDEQNELSDTMEFFGSEIDIDEIFKSEIEAYKSDYFYCDECKFLEGE